MIKDSILWTIGVAFPMIGSAIKASEGKYKLKDALLDNLKVAVVIEFIVNLYVFDLWIELLFIPFMTLIAIMMAYSEKKPEHGAVYKLLSLITTVIGIIMLYHAATAIVGDFKGFATFTNFESFIFPLFMSGLYLPFIYLLAVYNAYEQFFLRIDNAYRHHKQMIPFVKWKIFKKGHLNLKMLRMLSKDLHIYELLNRDEFITAINRF